MSGSLAVKEPGSFLFWRKQKMERQQLPVGVLAGREQAGEELGCIHSFLVHSWWMFISLCGER